MAKTRKQPKERISRLGLADPRTGSERIAGMVNRVFQGAHAGRKYDDSPSEMARRRKLDKKKK